MLARIRLWVINTFIAAILAIVAIDALPQSPTALRVWIQPLVRGAGIAQGPWNLFAPEPDRVNRRLRAEIEYADGSKVEWSTPVWRERSLSEMFLIHRQRCWWDRMISPDYASAWEPTCRYLALHNRPNESVEIAGTKVRLLYHEALVPPAEAKPWASFRTPVPFDDGWLLTSETLE